MKEKLTQVSKCIQSVFKALTTLSFPNPLFLFVIYSPVSRPRIANIIHDKHSIWNYMEIRLMGLLETEMEFSSLARIINQTMPVLRCIPTAKTSSTCYMPFTISSLIHVTQNNRRGNINPVSLHLFSVIL